MKIKKVLIANRGEIAIRIHHSLKELNIQTVGIYSEEDKESYHRFVLDESYSLGKGNLLETYLNIDRILSIAKKTHSDAIHPGYGFLSENYIFARACEEEQICFLGPKAEVIQLMGDKLRSKEIVKNLNVPILESLTGTVEEIIHKIEESKINFPLLVKASAGGGGKGMKILYNFQNLKENLESSVREAEKYFGDGRIFLEQYLENPKHIEVQIIGDLHGNIFHLFERECSIQRRYQKIIEEAPSPSLNDKDRQILYDYALRIAKKIDYSSLGTVEFLFDSHQFYFLEMNTRIQVEHPVTEMITGLDLVKEQIRIAEGETINFCEIQKKGSAIEVRVYAEDPENQFVPSPGKILYYQEPKGLNLRVDSSVQKPTTISSNFDPMISKVISYGKDREEARTRLIQGLKNYVILGIQTNLNYLIDILESEDFIQNRFSTNFCNEFRTKKKEEDYEILMLAIELYKKQKHLFKKEFSQVSENSIWKTIGYWRNV